MSDNQPATRIAPQKSYTKRYLIIAVKVLIGCAIIAFLISRVDRESFEKIASGPKRIDYLFLAFLWVLGAHIIGYIRWWQLVRSLGVKFSLGAAIRVGFLGTAFNQISFGAVGGDLFKAVVASRSAPKKIPEVIASIIVDRIVGLIGLILVTCAAMEAYVRMGTEGTLPTALQLIRQYVWVASIASIVGVILLVTCGKYVPSELFARLPIVGNMSSRMASAAKQFHGRPFLVLMQIGTSCAVHIALTLGFYLCSQGLSPDAPDLLVHLITIPPSFVVAAVPIMPGGAGQFELAVIQFMEAALGKEDEFMKVIVAVSFVYRLLLIAIAAIGGFYYLFGFGKLAQEDSQLVAEMAKH